MMRKDVTPYTDKNRNRGGFKRLMSSVLGGAIGGAVIIGASFILLKPSFGLNPTDELSTKSPTDNTGAKISNIKYEVDSDTSQAVEKVQKAVVSVVNLQTKQQGNSLGGLFGEQEQEEGQDTDGDMQAAGEGSGVIYRKDNKKAYIVTNNHVVENHNALQVLLNDGTKLDAKLVGRDVYTDLAVLEVVSDKITTAAEFGDSDLIKVGEPAIAIGSPLGSVYANSATQGIISAKDRKIINQSESGQPININAIQTDAAINPGNSGGPLINIAGQIIGINSVKIAQATNGVAAEGMGFSIPSNDVVSIITQLEKDGKVTRPMLGITMSDLSVVSKEQQEKILKIPTEITGGVIIRSVQPASPAEKAGLAQYDVIVEVDGKEVADGTDLQSALYKKKVGETVKVTYYREDKKKTVEIELAIEQVTAKEKR